MSREMQTRPRLARSGPPQIGVRFGVRQCRPEWWLSSVLALAVLLVSFSLAHAQTTYPPSPPYQSLRYDEDYRYLRDLSRRTDVWDVLKYVPLRDDGARYLSIGGELRERYEYFHNSLWGQGPQDDDGFLLQRYMLHADVHIGERMRVFGQLKSGLESGRTGGPRPPDEDELDLHQAFVDLAVYPRLMMRAGRQELAFGSSRLVSVREGPNVRQSFDGLRVMLTTTPWRIDAFITLPVKTRRRVFDDASDHARLFWGVYVVRPLAFLPKGNIDLYYLGLDSKQAEFDQGTAHELRHSLGTRLWGKPDPWDYNCEFVYQWGRFGRGAITAWTAASDAGYTFRAMRFPPRLGLKADIASGDRDPRRQGLQTFNALFPKGSYFNEASLIGPANFFDVHPNLTLQLAEQVRFTVDWDFFWRQSLRDGIYGNAVNLVRSGQGSRARYIGSAPTVQTEWEAERHMTLTMNYTHFFAGTYLRQSGPGKDVDFVATWVTYRF